MSAESKPQLSNTHEQQVNAVGASAGSTPEAEVTPTVPNFRKGFMKARSHGQCLSVGFSSARHPGGRRTHGQKIIVATSLMGMGENPREYREMMESLLEDLQLGLESHRVEQMGETSWRMRRSQRIRDGLALKNIKVPGEDMAATVRSFQAFEAMEPFERLKKAR